jgi:hypothetical protein
MSITQIVCTFVDLGIQHAMRMRHIIICDLPHSTIFFCIIGTIVEESYWISRCVTSYSTILSEIFFIIRRIKRGIVENIFWSSCKHPLHVSDSNETWISRQNFEKSWNIKFRENLSSGSRVVPCGQTDKTKLIDAFRKFANVPKKSLLQNTTLQTQNRLLCIASKWCNQGVFSRWSLGFLYSRG